MCQCFSLIKRATLIRRDIGFEISFPHHSTCLGFPIEMPMNFMDNVVDSVPYVFTKGQAYRMQSVLSNGGLRSSLQLNNIVCLDSLLLSTDEDFFGNVNSADVFPNPASDRLTILFKESEPFRISLIESSGRVCMRIFLNKEWGDKLDLDLSECVSGIYFLRIESASSLGVVPIIINK